MQRRVLVFGTFDGLHDGHLFLLRSAKSFGNELVVAVARDEHVLAFKHKVPIQDEQKRLKAIEHLAYVDRAVLCDEIIGSFEILDTLRPDLIVLGHDQEDLEATLKTWMQANRLIPTKRVEAFFQEKCHNCTCC